MNSGMQRLLRGFIAVTGFDFGLLNPFFREAGSRIKDYSALFIFEDGEMGSGTFINIGGFMGILTAYHVAEYLYRFKEFRLCIADYPHRLTIESSILKHVPIGIPPKGCKPEVGPDLSFLIIQDPTLVEAIHCEKIFYNLDFAPDYSVHEPLNPKFWCPTGTYFDSLRLLADNYKDDGPLKRLANFVGTGVFPYELSKDKDGQFDYLKFVVPAGPYGFPNNYKGISGGGFWLIPFETEADANGKADDKKIGFRPPFLAGVEYSQSDPNLTDRERTLYGHGPASISLVRQVLKSKTSSLYPPSGKAYFFQRSVLLVDRRQKV
jgi:hypothetical protein